MEEWSIRKEQARHRQGRRREAIQRGRKTINNQEREGKKKIILLFSYAHFPKNAVFEAKKGTSPFPSSKMTPCSALEDPRLR